MVVRTLAFVVVRRVLGLVGLGSAPDAKDIEIAVHSRTVGVLSLYRATAGPLSAPDHDQVDRYTYAVTVLLLDDPHIASAGQVNIALPIRAGEVQQAVGVVMQYADVDAATALHRLRAYAHQSTRPMRDVVAEVRTCRLPFDPTTPT